MGSSKGWGRWSKAERAKLRRWLKASPARRLTAAELAVELGRSLSSVKSELSRLRSEERDR